MKKYIYFVTNQEHWFNVAKKLYNNKIAEPVLWLGDDVHYNKAKNLFGDSVIMDLEHRHRNFNLIDIDYNSEYIDFFSSENYLRAKDICLKMMDRLDLYGVFGRLDREVYFHKILIWNLKKIYYSKPDVLITAEAPHDYPKYLIFEICKYLNIPCYKFSNWMPVPLLFMENMITKNLVTKDKPMKSQIDDRMNKEIKSFIEKLQTGKEKYELFYMKSQRVSSRPINRIKSYFLRGFVEDLKDVKYNLEMFFKSSYNPINPFTLNYFTRKRNQRLRKKNLIKEISYIEETVSDDLKYVYFPLHYEPERTTNPDGGFFHDQFIALTYLRKFIPSDIQIVVKEHPSQLNVNMRGSRGRSPLIYKLIKNIKGVRLAKTDSNSIKLILNSEFIATISGSVALEASILGKKSITFGSSWYKGCPNIFEWDQITSYQNMISKKIKSCDDIYDFLINHKNKYAVSGFINGSQRKFFKSYADDDFELKQNKEIYNLLLNFFKNL